MYEHYTEQTDIFTIDDQRSQLLSQYQPGTLTHEYIQWLQKEYAGDANTINYVTTLLSGLLTEDKSEFEHAETETLDNLRTATIEHPIADAVGEYHYSMDWYKDKGTIKLKSQFGFVDDMLIEAVDNRSGQIPAFEMQRNYQNRQFYEKLKEQRSKGNRSTMIEFSPSPINILSEEVKKRGYKGNDTVLFYTQDNEGKEQVTQYWFPGISLTEYRSLLYSLQSICPNQNIQRILEKTELSDVDIMSISGNFTPEQIDVVSRFIQERQLHFSKHKDAILNYSETTTSEELRERALPVLYSLAGKLLGETPSYEIKSDLENIRRIIDTLQFELRLYMRDMLQTDTFTQEVSTRLNENGINYETFAGLTYLQQLEKSKSSGYQASGCGFGGEIVYHFDSLQERWGNFSSIINKYPENFGHAHEGECRLCHKVKIVGGCDVCVDCHLRISSRNN